MSRVYVDTSAFLALLLSSDRNHRRAAHVFHDLASRDTALLTSSYVLVETYALLHRRVGLDAVRAFRQDLAPLLEVAWVDADLHERGLDLLLDRRWRRLSLVDATSFHIIRSHRIEDVFAYDGHFEREGFRLLP